mmetsp:Transcript_2187/g.2120  ORF Transcript_2187/g.2120 Transcript_2187/m.2120 type:complete len:84 (+) Transcript_2187:1838-2089(+)
MMEKQEEIKKKVKRNKKWLHLVNLFIIIKEMNSIYKIHRDDVIYRQLKHDSAVKIQRNFRRFLKKKRQDSEDRVIQLLKFTFL